MFQDEVIGILTRAGAFSRGHMVYTSGQHGEVYVDKDVIYPNTTHMLRFGGMAAELIAGHLYGHGAQRLDLDTVLSPAGGAIAFGQWVGYSVQHLSSRRRVLCAYAEKTDDNGFQLLRRYDELVRDKGVLIVDDVLNSGGTTRKLVELVRKAGGRVLGVVAICNRGSLTAADIGLDYAEPGGGTSPFFLSLATVPFEAWSAKTCRMCAAGVHVRTDIGKGRDFLAWKNMTLPQRAAALVIRRLQRFLQRRHAA